MTAIARFRLQTSASQLRNCFDAFRFLRAVTRREVRLQVASARVITARVITGQAVAMNRYC